ncbi:MAG: carboxylating nicotinate-nucleotide diphosphorylase [bacterium]|nr:carboxylating nicotinate-nucleotide diphosphorylase [bacterium]
MDGAADATIDRVRRALAEDLGCADGGSSGQMAPPGSTALGSTALGLGAAGGLRLESDVTSHLAVPADARGRARMVSKASGVLAGLDCATAAFRLLDSGSRVDLARRDGDAVEPGVEVLRVEAAMPALLAAERTALNFVQRLSGVATLTRQFVDAVAGTGARILDTRKTTPGLRLLEKAAVVAGGGHNHRIGLFDQVLLKENHFALARPVGYEEVVRRCVDNPDRTAPVIAEARTVDEAVAAVRGGADVVLLDNFAAGKPLRAAVAAVQATAHELSRQVETEASGGIDLQTVRAFAECGVDRISVGAVTHSAPALDLSLLVEGVAA